MCIIVLGVQGQHEAEGGPITELAAEDWTPGDLGTGAPHTSQSEPLQIASLRGVPADEGHGQGGWSGHKRCSWALCLQIPMWSLRWGKPEKMQGQCGDLTSGELFPSGLQTALPAPSVCSCCGSTSCVLVCWAAGMSCYRWDTHSSGVQEKGAGRFGFW